MIRLVNKRTYRGAGVYIGRPSLLGNPFKIGVHGERADVISLYRQWLCDRIVERGNVYAELKRLARLAKQGDLTLICWGSGRNFDFCYGKKTCAFGEA